MRGEGYLYLMRVGVGTEVQLIKYVSTTVARACGLPDAAYLIRQ
jgi:hypothetical protein